MKEKNTLSTISLKLEWNLTKILLITTFRNWNHVSKPMHWNFIFEITEWILIVNVKHLTCFWPSTVDLLEDKNKPRYLIPRTWTPRSTMQKKINVNHFPIFGTRVNNAFNRQFFSLVKQFLIYWLVHPTARIVWILMLSDFWSRM